MDEVGQIGPEPPEEAVVGLRHAHGVRGGALSRAALGDALLHLDDAGGLEATEDVQTVAVVLHLGAGRAALQPREDRLVDAAVRAAPGDVVQIAEAEAIGVDGVEGQAQTPAAPWRPRPSRRTACR